MKSFILRLLLGAGVAGGGSAIYHDVANARENTAVVKALPVNIERTVQTILRETEDGLGRLEAFHQLYENGNQEVQRKSAKLGELVKLRIRGYDHAAQSLQAIMFYGEDKVKTPDSSLDKQIAKLYRKCLGNIETLGDLASTERNLQNVPKLERLIKQNYSEQKDIFAGMRELIPRSAENLAIGEKIRYGNRTKWVVSHEAKDYRDVSEMVERMGAIRARATGIRFVDDAHDYQTTKKGRSGIMTIKKGRKDYSFDFSEGTFVEYDFHKNRSGDIVITDVGIKISHPAGGIMMNSWKARAEERKKVRLNAHPKKTDREYFDNLNKIARKYDVPIDSVQVPPLEDINGNGFGIIPGCIYFVKCRDGIGIIKLIECGYTPKHSATTPLKVEWKYHPK